MGWTVACGMRGPLPNSSQMCEVFDVTKELVSCRSRSELALSGTLGKNKKVWDACATAMMNSRCAV